MALIATFRDWLVDVITRRRCKLYGHPVVKTIETYRTEVRIKNWMVIGKKIVIIKPYKQIIIDGKHKCTACGTVFVGVIVKDEILHDEPHDTP